MGTPLAKFPQQRIRAGEKHPTVEKLERLFDFMDEIGLDLEFYHGRVYVTDHDRKNDKEWEIRDIVNSALLTQLPCDHGVYKLTQDVNVPARDAQPAPKHPKKKVVHKQHIGGPQKKKN